MWKKDGIIEMYKIEINLYFLFSNFSMKLIFHMELLSVSYKYTNKTQFKYFPVTYSLPMCYTCI